MDKLLESFLTAGLGLTLESRIGGVNQLPEIKIRPCHPLQESSRVCAAWRAAEGRVIICATYHSGHSKRLKAHVLWLEWWIPPQVHHEGWWRVEAKWPRYWIKGAGTPST
jgi:hypothetical protein